MDAPHIQTLQDSPHGAWRTVVGVTGERAFRRRLLELGFVPGTRVRVVGQAPMGDPLKLEIRHGSLSLRKAEAAGIVVAP
jgi:ferrous iron transport protein A